MTLFLYMVGMSKLFCSFGFGFNSNFYGTFYFVKSPIKTEHITLHFVWLTSEFLLILYFSEALLTFPYSIRHKIKNTINKSSLVKMFAVAAARSCCSLKFLKTSVLVSIFDKVVGLEACNFIKMWFQHRCLPVNIAKFLKNNFFYRKSPVAPFMSTRKRKEEESVEQKEEQFFKWKKIFLQFYFFWFLRFHFFVFLFHQADGKMSRVACISTFRNRHWEMFCKIAVWQDITKIVCFFFQNWS